jgi:hypothetical protein
MYRIVWEPMGIRGCNPLARRPNSLAVLHIHSTLSGPRIRRGSSIMSPVSLSTTAFVHSVGVVLAMSLLAVMVAMACIAISALVGPTRRAEVAVLVCCAVKPGYAWVAMMCSECLVVVILFACLVPCACVVCVRRRGIWVASFARCQSRGCCFLFAFCGCCFSPSLTCIGCGVAVCVRRLLPAHDGGFPC